MKMPWGKYRGQEIEDLPSSYLRWLAENINEKKPANKAVCLEADKEWRWRERNGEHR